MVKVILIFIFDEKEFFKKRRCFFVFKKGGKGVVVVE